MFKVNNRKTRKRWEICSKLMIETPERRSGSSINRNESIHGEVSWKRGTLEKRCMSLVKIRGIYLRGSLLLKLQVTQFLWKCFWRRLTCFNRLLLWTLTIQEDFFFKTIVTVISKNLNPSSANRTKWSNTLKQFVGGCRQIVWMCLTFCRIGA